MPDENAKAAPEVAVQAPEIKEKRIKQETQNGVVRPKNGTKTGAVRAIADAISAQRQAPADRKEVLELADAEGISKATAATQYGPWRKFHGIKKPVAPAKVETAPIVETAPAGETVAPAAE